MISASPLVGCCNYFSGRSLQVSTIILDISNLEFFLNKQLQYLVTVAVSNVKNWPTNRFSSTIKQ